MELNETSSCWGSRALSRLPCQTYLLWWAWFGEKRYGDCRDDADTGEDDGEMQEMNFGQDIGSRILFTTTAVWRGHGEVQHHASEAHSQTNH